jgi:hypothetical protein
VIVGAVVQLREKLAWFEGAQGQVRLLHRLLQKDRSLRQFLQG